MLTNIKVPQNIIAATVQCDCSCYCYGIEVLQPVVYPLVCNEVERTISADIVAIILYKFDSGCKNINIFLDIQEISGFF